MMAERGLSVSIIPRSLAGLESGAAAILRWIAGQKKEGPSMTARLLVFWGGVILVGVNPVTLAQVPSDVDRSGAGVNHDKSKELYVLGADDQIVLQGANVEELVNKPMRIDANGDVGFPMIGIVHAGGLTVRDVEALVTEKCKAYVRNPQIVISVTEFKSHPVSVVGAVTSPGIVQIQGFKTLVEVISLAGGVRADAGSRVTITRQVGKGKIPLSNVKLDSSGAFYSATANIKDITTGSNPEDNIQILEHDVISVPRAAMIYVVGEVRKAGGFLLGEDNSVTVVQALSLAEGAERTADLSKATIIRNQQNTSQRREFVCNIKDVLSGKTADVNLQARDILFIPGSKGKKVAMRTLETLIQTGSGMAIWGVR
jgi:polysaccharide export outer membrane protein